MALARTKPSYYRCLLDVSQQFIESEWTGVLESRLHTIWKVVTDRGCDRMRERERESDGSVCLLSHVPARVRSVVGFSFIFPALSLLLRAVTIRLHGHVPKNVIINSSAADFSID